VSAALVAPYGTIPGTAGSAEREAMLTTHPCRAINCFAASRVRPVGRRQVHVEQSLPAVFVDIDRFGTQLDACGIDQNVQPTAGGDSGLDHSRAEPGIGQIPADSGG
jgi:hypothetical protein